MQLIDLIKSLMKYKTITGNLPEIKKCLQYIQDILRPIGAHVQIYEQNGFPVIMATNTADTHLDALVLGHIDVVPAEDDMFQPYVENGLIHGRGSLDMKSFAAVAINSLEYVIKHNLNLKFGFIFSTDEEKGSFSLETFVKNHPQVSTKIVLDNDVGGDITKIVTKCKNPVFIKLISHGKAAHGSTPWEGVDANENLFKAWKNIRKIYPAMPVKPQNTWCDTVHFAKITGGAVNNIISDYAEALLDFRLTDSSGLEKLKENLTNAMPEGVSFEVISSSIPVITDEKSPVLNAYKTLAEKVLKKKIEFEYIGGATDSHIFYPTGALIIMHSGTGEGMHAENEYVVFESVEQIAEIQTLFLEQLAERNML